MKKILLVSLCLLLTSTVAFADWDPGDGHKMHFPQLPDPNGWDVNATVPNVVADDWKCSGTGAVGDIHFWGSWRYDQVAPIDLIHVSIHKDDRTNPEYSRPGELLWARDFFPGDFTVRDWGTGDQGWFEPPEYVEHDHIGIYQYNIEKIRDPFFQEEGNIYWLDISVFTNGLWGWKTSLDHFEDDAVWFNPDVGGWEELRDPITGESLDMAFVITPIPGAVWLLGSGLIGLVGFRRKFRK